MGLVGRGAAGEEWLVVVRTGGVGSHTARSGVAWQARFGVAWRGVAWSGLAWQDFIWCG